MNAPNNPDAKRVNEPFTLRGGFVDRSNHRLASPQRVQACVPGNHLICYFAAKEAA